MGKKKKGKAGNSSSHHEDVKLDKRCRERYLAEEYITVGDEMRQMGRGR